MSGLPEAPRQTFAEWLRDAEEDFAVAEREFSCPQIGGVEAEEALAVARRIRARAREMLVEWRPQ